MYKHELDKHKLEVKNASTNSVQTILLIALLNYRYRIFDKANMPWIGIKCINK